MKLENYKFPKIWILFQDNICMKLSIGRYRYLNYELNSSSFYTIRYSSKVKVDLIEITKIS